MSNTLEPVRIGVLICISILLFGIALGVGFGINEDIFKDMISEGIAAFPQLHDANSSSKIWRYVQRAHFHALGIAAFSMTLILVVALSSLSASRKKVTAILISLGGTYAFSWLTMFFLSPSMGRHGAHGSFLTEFWVYLGVGSLLLGIAILIANLTFGYGKDAEGSVSAGHAS
ncbi:MAG: hypothetical protein ACJAWL_001857 [Motiliproteus sp.]|jgi:hypothetical protein